MSEDVEHDPIADLRTYLREQAELTPSRKPSGYEAVKAVLPEIKALKAKRRTDAEICAFLANKGIPLSIATLRQYIQNATREAGGTKLVRTRGKAKSKPSGKSPQVQTKRQPNPVANPGVAGGTPSLDERAAGSRTTGHILSDREL